jgi:hypothetical protein
VNGSTCLGSMLAPGGVNGSWHSGFPSNWPTLATRRRCDPAFIYLPVGRPSLNPAATISEDCNRIDLARKEGATNDAANSVETKAAPGLKIPLILNEPVNIDEEGLLAHEFDELLHERPQSRLRHSWHQLVVQAALPE